MNTAKVSILLPTFNGSRRLAQAIESVLAQTYTDWELLILDDGSVDDTRDIVYEYAKADPRIRYERNPENLGIQKTLNRGLDIAKGEFIARIDDDDRWVDTEKLEKQVDFLKSNADYILVGTAVIVVDEDGNELFRYKNPESDEALRRVILARNPFAHSTVLFRRDSAIGAGKYPEDPLTRHLEDYDFWLRLGTKGKFANLPRYGVAFTLRDSALSSKNKKEQLQKIPQIAKRYQKQYPRYYRAVGVARSRALLYQMVGGWIPKGLHRWVFSLHKKTTRGSSRKKEV